MSIIEVENIFLHRSFKLKAPVEIVTDKLIMSLDALHTSNSHRQIDHQQCTILVNETVILDVIFQNYFQESLLEDVIFENFHQVVLNQ